MSKNKLASFRYRIINNCLQNRARNWSRLDLMEEIDKQLNDSFGIDSGISKRTFHYDIELMRRLHPGGFDAPIIVKEGYYKYDNPNFSIDNSPLTEMDIENIDNAVELLSQFKQLPIHSQLSVIKGKVAGQISTNQDTEPIIELEHRTVKGTEFLTPIYNTIKDKQVINAKYHSFNSPEPKEFVLHPYFLKQYNHRWYLVAFSEQFKNVGTYSLDRFVSFDKMKGIQYNECLNNSHSTHFENVIGITLPQNEKPIEIIAKVSSNQAPYLITKPLHSSQVILQEDENGITTSLTLIPNYEFYSTILGLGANIEIISPEFVREKLIEMIKNAYDNYTP